MQVDLGSDHTVTAVVTQVGEEAEILPIQARGGVIAASPPTRGSKN